MNLGNYIEDIRFKKAVSLLTNFHVKIKDIASSVGYNDPNYFTKVFKKTHRYDAGGISAKRLR